MTRLAYQIPPACSACAGQYPDLRHVDFEAAWDGPVLSDGTPGAQIDDLILCERCVRSGAQLIGMVPEDDSRVAQLEHDLHAEEQRREEIEKYAGQLELAVQNAPRKPVRRPPGRPRKDQLQEA